MQPVTGGPTAPLVPSRPPARLALLAGLVTVVLWASAFVGIRDAGKALSPGPLALLRLVVACAVLGAFVAWRRDPFPPRRLLPGLVACGVLWLGVYNLALNAAEQRVDAGTAAMLVNLGPIFIAVLAGLVLREGFPRNLLIGAAIAFLGCVVIGLSLSAESTTLGVGALLCVVAAAAYASGVILQKPLLREISALQVTFLACAVGAVVCLPFVAQLADELPNAPAESVAWAIYLGVFPTALAFTTWAYALARTSAGRMGALTYLVPPIAILLGWALLDEVPPGLAIVGGALCLAGVIWTRRG